jgi:hypothetical protein
MSIPLAVRSKAWVWGRSIAGLEDSNPAEDMDVCLLWVLCVVADRSLRRANHSSTGVLPGVCVQLCPVVWRRRNLFPLKLDSDAGRPVRSNSLYPLCWLVKTNLKFPLWQALRLQSYGLWRRAFRKRHTKHNVWDWNNQIISDMRQRKRICHAPAFSVLGTVKVNIV